MSFERLPRALSRALPWRLTRNMTEAAVEAVGRFIERVEAFLPAPSAPAPADCHLSNAEAVNEGCL
jgi:hypothetical protein